MPYLIYISKRLISDAHRLRGKVKRTLASQIGERVGTQTAQTGAATSGRADESRSAAEDVASKGGQTGGAVDDIQEE